MKKLIAMLSFFYVSWNVCVDGTKDYSHSKEDVYGIKRSSILRSTQSASADGFISFNGEGMREDCYRRHRTFENEHDLKEFLRHAPQKVQDVNSTEITGQP